MTAADTPDQDLAARYPAKVLVAVPRAPALSRMLSGETILAARVEEQVVAPISTGRRTAAVPATRAFVQDHRTGCVAQVAKLFARDSVAHRVGVAPTREFAAQAPSPCHATAFVALRAWSVWELAASRPMSTVVRAARLRALFAARIAVARLTLVARLLAEQLAALALAAAAPAVALMTSA
jgi:hypothetical protein